MVNTCVRERTQTDTDTHNTHTHPPLVSLALGPDLRNLQTIELAA